MRSARTAQRPARGVLSGLRIRKKLIVLHTSFSLGLGVLLLIALSPAMTKLITGAEQDQALLLLEASADLDALERIEGEHKRIRAGEPGSMGLSESIVERAVSSDRGWVSLPQNSFGAGVLVWDSERARLIEIRAQAVRARDQARIIYTLLIVSLLAGYAFVAIALELFVLPQHVYSPIRALLEADRAVQEKDAAREIVPSEMIPQDELGEIMHSRNDTVRELRAHQGELASALTRLESVAVDMHTKNKLLEAARRNLEGADRLASLGMMSAGIAHELNTPLAVVKGLVEKLNDQGTLSETDTSLLTRVVKRIEKLSEGLLDFARARTPELKTVRIAGVIDDAWHLLRLDQRVIRACEGLAFENTIDPGLEIPCDADRMVQVFVNLIRNAVNAMARAKTQDPRVVVSAHTERREGEDWIVLRVSDTGPGIDPEMMGSLFEPFVSTTLDAKGTGLGLAVSDGIVREHGGFLTPSNRTDESGNLRGACFDVFMPAASPSADPEAQEKDPDPARQG